MTETVTSVNGIAIRLTDERWAHITEEHSELAGMRFEVLETLAQPLRVYEGGKSECLAIREIETGKFLVAVYREADADGFVITAFLTRRIKSLEKREILWSPQN
jgi:hypothetical protein